MQLLNKTAICFLLGFIALVLGASLSPLYAVQPDEILTDKTLETRARAISRNLRCPICQGENIDDSSAQISRDLRLLVRERLVAGDSDNEVVDFIVARYGEFVLFKPRMAGENLILWFAGPGLLILGGIVVFVYLRRRSLGHSHSSNGGNAKGDTPLSKAELERINELMK